MRDTPLAPLKRGTENTPLAPLERGTVSTAKDALLLVKNIFKSMNYSPLERGRGCVNIRVITPISRGAGGVSRNTIFTKKHETEENHPIQPQTQRICPSAKEQFH